MTTPFRKRSIALFTLAGIALLIGTPIASTYVHIVREQIDYNRFARGSISLTTYMAVGGIYEAAVSAYKSAIIATTAPPVPRVSPLPDVRLRVSKGSLNALGADRPHSTRARYYNATLRYPDGKWRPINYRMRGSSSWHHQPQKPSLRLKLKRSHPIGLLRHINLINPEDRSMLSNILADDLAREMGVLAHASKFVRVFINDRFYGVYQMQTRGDEEMLRHAGRMPGPLFLGENLKATWGGEQFEHKGDQKFVKGLPINPIKRLVNAISLADRHEQLADLWAILDFDKYARYQAVVTLVDSWHIDAFHNQGFYFDPSRGLLEPILVDANGHGMTTYPATWRRFTQPWEPHYTGPLNGLNHPLTDVATVDPRFHHAKNMYIWSALKGVGSVESQHRAMKSYFSQIDADVRADRHKGSIYRSFVGYTRFPYTNADYEVAKRQMLEWVENRNSFLKREISKSRVYLRLGRKDDSGRAALKIIVSGNSAATFDAGPLANRVFADFDLDETADQSVRGHQILYPGLLADPDYAYEHQTYGRANPKRTYFAGAQAYLFSVADLDNLKNWLSKAFKNAVTGADIVPEWIKEVPPELALKLSENQSVHAWRLRSKQVPAQVVIGPGRVEFAADLRIPAGQTLKINPGTDLRLAPGVSLLVRGKLDMKGTRERPIIVDRLDQKQPWGSILVMGPAAVGSAMDHVIISGGSKSADGLLNTLGMVNIHWVPGFSLRNARIHGNIGSDDTVHIIHSKFEISDLVMDGCAFDCIDLDHATGSLHEVKILNAGNDGIDFMESRAVVTNATISGVGDKGLSIGERSIVTATRGQIDNAAIGIAVKDRSRLHLSQWSVFDSEFGIEIYRKNWRYGKPGSAVIKTSLFRRNKTNFRVQRDGRLSLDDALIPAGTSGNGEIGANSEPSS